VRALTQTKFEMRIFPQAVQSLQVVAIHQGL
jgi:hypothetical protein